MAQEPLSDDDLRRAFDAADRAAQSGDAQATDDARAFAQELQRRGMLGEPERRAAGQSSSSAISLVQQPFAGFNEGVDNLFTTAQSAGRIVTDRIFEGANLLAGEEIFDTSQPSGFRPIQLAQEAITGQSYADLPANTAPERVLRRVGEEVAYAAPAAIGVGAAARAPGAVNAVSNARSVGSAVVAPAVQQAARTPGAYLAAEGGSALLSGVGAGVGREVGGDTGELVGQIGAPLAAFGGAAGVRALARGHGDGAAQAAQATVDAFERVGSAPTISQVGTRNGSPSLVALVDRSLTRVPGANLRMTRVLENQQEALGRRATQLADGLSVDAGAEAGGSAIQRGIRGFIARSGRRADALYGEVEALIPPNTRVQMTNAQETARRIMSEQLGEGLDNAQVQRIARTINESNGASYEQLSRIRSRIGRLVDDVSLISSKPELDRLYSALSDDLAVAARDAGPQAEQAMRRANRYYRAYRTRVDEQLRPLTTGQRGNIPEEAFRALERGGRDGATRLRALRSSVTDDQWDVITSATVRRLGRARGGAQNELGDAFSSKTFLTNWSNLSPEARQALFGGARYRGMRRDLDAIAEAAARIREANQVLGNPSGTADALTGVSPLVAVAVSPGAWMQISGGVLGANAAARLFTNRRFVRWLAQATRVPVERGPSYLSRLSSVMANQSAEDIEAAQEYVRALQGALVEDVVDHSQVRPQEQQHQSPEDNRPNAVGEGTPHRK